MTWHGLEGMEMTWKWNGMEMACHGMSWKRIALAWKFYDMERHGNDM